MSRECGCRYVEAGGQWWHVVACPDHNLDLGPLDKVPGP